MRPLICTSFVFLALACAARPGCAGASEEIQSARQAGSAVFIVVTDRDARGTDQALDVARRAQALAPGTTVVLLDRGAVENAELVKTYRLLGAPVPLVLVVAPNGVVAGGALLKDATPEVLVALVPTPKKAEMLLALSQRLPVFVVATGPEMKGRAEVIEAMRQAYEAMKRKVVTVGINIRDVQEKRFLTELKVDPASKAPVVIVYNAKGEKTAVFRGAVTAAQLVAAAQKKAECCPGGSC